jgi:hypothetical protein
MNGVGLNGESRSYWETIPWTDINNEMFIVRRGEE